MSTGFIQFCFCKICRRNHQDGKKHVYTKYHRNTLNNLLGRFSKKINEMKKILAEPEIHDKNWEDKNRFWCYFCEEEVIKHFTDEKVTISYFGMINHLASKEHQKATKKFYWENKLDKKKLSKYIIDDKILERFSKKIPALRTNYEIKLNNHHKESVQRIRDIEAERQKTVENAYTEVCWWSSYTLF